MARIRTIKPEFFTSLTIADLPLSARLTFIGLWTHVDDEGRCVDDARLIKAAVWPLDDITAADVEEDLRLIHSKKLITRYLVGGKQFVAVTNWSEHQRINRPTPSKLPSPSDGQPLPPTPQDSVRAHGGVSEGSNAPSEKAHEGSRSGATAGSSAGPSPNGLQSAQSAPPVPHDEGLTSANTDDMGDSVSPHGALAEDSPPERKGTGNRERKGTPLPPAAPSAAAALDEDRDEGPLPDRMFAGWWERYGRTTAQSRRGIRSAISDALTNGLDPVELWDALVQLGDLSKPITGGTLQFALAEIRRRRLPAGGAQVIALPSAQPRPSTADQRAGAAFALAAELRAQEGRSS